MKLEDFRFFYPKFQNIDDKIITYYLMEFYVVENLRWGKYFDQAQGLWTAHMIITNPEYFDFFDQDFLADAVSQEFSSASVGDVSFTTLPQRYVERTADIILNDYVASIYGRRFLMYKAKILSLVKIVKT